MPVLPNTIYNLLLSDAIASDAFIEKQQAQYLFQFFKGCSLFRWQDANNDCEDRANAICMLLDKWGVHNCKGWIFGSNFLTNEQGYLINNWKYHVAAMVPVKEEGQVNFYVIDPAILQGMNTILNWATCITDSPFSHYIIKYSHYYIFPEGTIERDNWHKRNLQNYKWTIQGLAGINGVGKTGKAEITFNKNRLKNTEKRFKELLKTKPAFL